MCKQFVGLAILVLASAVTANAQNVGIGNTSPDEKLHVTGKVKIEHALVVKPVSKTAAATIAITSNDGFVVIAHASGTQANAMSMTGTPTDGQVLTIRNDDADDDATFSGATITASTTMQFTYTNSTWKRLGSPSGAATITAIADADADTKIQVEESADEDVIRFDLGGTEKWKIVGSRLEPLNTGKSTFIGFEAGLNDDLSTNFNTAFGYQTLKFNTSGSGNTASGNNALFANTSGSNNVAIGLSALVNNATGSGNVALGYGAGSAETGSNKLYIDNSGTSSPLIYGDFSSNLLRVNGTLNINNRYSLPTYDGSSNQVLVTNGSGTLRWATNSISGFADADNDTKIQVEKTTDDDIIRFDLGGTQKWQMVDSRLEPVNTGNSIFIGELAGYNDDLTSNANNGIGDGSMYSNTTGNYNVGNGYRTLNKNTTGSKNTASGSYAMYNNTTGIENVAIGYYAMRYSTTGNYNSAMGSFALFRNTTGLNNVAIGANVLFDNTTGANNTASGFQASENNTTGDNNTAYGYQALYRNSTGSDNVALGYQAGWLSTGSNKLYIANAPGNPLIYGEFDNDLVRIYGTLNINNKFSLPTVDGSVDQVLATDGSGVLSWTTLSTTSPIITDADNDTKIQVEESTDEDIIRFDIGGTEKWLMTGSRLEPSNTGYSTFIGLNAGLNDDLSYNYNSAFGTWALTRNTTGERNTAIGVRSLEDNTSGSYNVANGYTALQDNTTGDYNVAIGESALRDITTGDNNVAIGSSASLKVAAGSNNTSVGYRALAYNSNGNLNVALGYQAGIYETGSNKLYIANSDTTNPLIYGEFDNNLLRINGILNVNNAFSFPTIDGSSGQVLVTNGSGTLSWSTNSVNGIADTDNDTKIQVEESADEDIIRFDLGGTEKWAMKGSRLEPSNTGNSTFIGFEAGINDDLTTNNNTAIGYRALYTNTSGYSNVALGYEAGRSSKYYAVENVFLGYQAGYSASTGNVMIGYQAGYSETGSKKLYIANSSTTSPLIYGEFGNQVVEINGTLRPGANDKYLLGDYSHLWKAVYAKNGTIQTSDERFKKNITTMNYGLDELMALRSVTYQWKEDSLGETKLGFIAQELELIVPEVVSIGTDSMQTRGVNYAELIPVLVKAIQEQQAIIENQKVQATAQQNDLDLYKGQTEAQEERLQTLEAKLDMLLGNQSVSK